MKTKLTIAFGVMVASAAIASWIDLSLEKVIQQSHVVVIGEITHVTAADPPKDGIMYQYDVADITVKEVLFNNLTNRVVAPKQNLPLSMPSVKNRARMSTDIRYEVGARGIWILELRDGTFWATYPKDYQPMSSEKEIRQIVQKLRTDSSTNRLQERPNVREMVFPLDSVPTEK